MTNRGFAPSAQVHVWDLVVRITHWLTASCVLANLVLLEDGSRLHRWAGYIALGSVILRLLWGFVGGLHARFKSWLPTPERLFPYLKLLLNGKPPRYLGHNPAGAVAMLLMWALVIALAISGYLMSTDEYFGEEWLESLHGFLANALLAIVLLHITAALAESWRHGENLVRSMFTGNKRDEPPPQP